MEKPLPEKTLEYIQEKLRTKVLEQYAEKQDIKSQESELEASMQALHELTEIPIDDIRFLAKKIIEEYELKHKAKTENTKPLQKPAEVENYSLDYFSMNLEKNKRNFAHHLVSFVIVNIMLIVLNSITSPQFPWAMFPFFGWSIGLISHYLKDVYWAKRDIELQRNSIKSQSHDILSENIPAYQYEREKIFNGVYRLLMSGCRLSELELFLYTFVEENKKRQAENAAYQLIRIRDNYIEQHLELHSNKGKRHRNMNR